MSLFDGAKFTRNGRTFTVEFPRDDSTGPPWKEFDGDGIVSDWTTRAKRPGERLLRDDHGSKRYFDFEATLKKAIKEEWGIGDSPQRPGESKRAYAVRAVEKNFIYLKGWANDEWSWCGVVVKCGKEEESLWGIADNEYKYLEETAYELADELDARLTEAEELADAKAKQQLGYEYGVTL